MTEADDVEEEKSAEPKVYGSRFEEHWEGWIKSLGPIVLFGIAFALYKFELISESVSGAGVVLIVVLGAVGSSAWPAWRFVREPWQKSLFLVMSAIWLVSAAYPTLRVVLPRKVLAEAHLTNSQKGATLDTHESGPYEISVSGHFKDERGDADAGYLIKAEGGGGSDEVAGDLERKRATARAGRKGGTISYIQERTESSHRLETVKGGQIKLSIDDVDEKLEDGLTVAVQSAGLNPMIFLVLGALVILVALFFDVKLTDIKGKSAKSYLAAGAAFTYAFALHFPMEATPHRVVRPAVGSMFLALLVGAAPGSLLAIMGRFFNKPKLKKKLN